MPSQFVSSIFASAHSVESFLGRPVANRIMARVILGRPVADHIMARMIENLLGNFSCTSGCLKLPSFCMNEFLYNVAHLSCGKGLHLFTTIFDGTVFALEQQQPHRVYIVIKITEFIQIFSAFSIVFSCPRLS